MPAMAGAHCRRAPPEGGAAELQQLQVHSRGLAVTAALEVVADLLAFDEGADAGLLEGRHVDERVLAAIFRSNEAEALGRIEELYGSVDHLSVTFEVNARRFRRTSLRRGDMPGRPTVHNVK